MKYINKNIKDSTSTGISLKNRYDQLMSSNDVVNRLFAVSRALGFKEPYDGTCAIRSVKHKIHFGDVETVVKWLFDNGYDIIEPKTNNDEIHK